MKDIDRDRYLQYFIHPFAGKFLNDLKIISSALSVEKLIEITSRFKILITKQENRIKLDITTDEIKNRFEFELLLGLLSIMNHRPELLVSSRSFNSLVRKNKNFRNEISDFVIRLVEKIKRESIDAEHLQTNKKKSLLTLIPSKRVDKIAM
ncbi:hypothetical protein [Deefgea sp. CFH1-16]|uniref:hypothetical protein n=1 Tax=Deefgea sp. CFH1-16 TaxID=2675457 RepID=UPI0015F569B9|nr:hypothetical protein [Deefgea sp. CFH1-16]MBM5574270.1 hypothetical protein [Deefgea sp. CFH1-16]